MLSVVAKLPSRAGVNDAQDMKPSPTIAGSFEGFCLYKPGMYPRMYGCSLSLNIKTAGVETHGGRTLKVRFGRFYVSMV